MTCLCKDCEHLEEDTSCNILLENVYIETEDSGIIAIRIEPCDDFGCIYGEMK